MSYQLVESENFSVKGHTCSLNALPFCVYWAEFSCRTQREAAHTAVQRSHAKLGEFAYYKLDVK